MEKVILKDIKMANQMEKNGFIVLPFLNKEEINKFKLLYKKHHSVDPEFFYKSYFSDNIEYKREVEREIISAFNKNLNDFFANHISFGGMFVVKPPLEKGHFTAHQDWSFTDEFMYPSYNMWCPLEDVNDENGNLNVLYGSHKYIKTIRGYNTPDVYDQLQHIIEPNMKSIPMKAGEVIIFYHGLIHGSTKNTTNKSRISLGLSLIHQDAPLRYNYYDDSTQTLEEYASNPDFYINYVAHKESKPQNINFIQNVNFSFPRLTEDELRKKIIQSQGDDKSAPIKRETRRSILSFLKNTK